MNSIGVRGVTPEEWLAMPGGKRYELADGIPIEKSSSLLSSRVAAKVCWILDASCTENSLFPPVGPQEPEAATVAAPSAS